MDDDGLIDPTAPDLGDTDADCDYPAWLDDEADDKRQLDAETAYNADDYNRDYPNGEPQLKPVPFGWASLADLPPELLATGLVHPEGEERGVWRE